MSLLPICFLEENMSPKTQTESALDKLVTVEEVNRLLEVERLLFSMLIPEEIESLQELLNTQNQLGNTGDS
jgi:hypothetical protein